MDRGTTHILIIDDMLEDREIYVRFLERAPGHDYRISTAEDGETGLERLKSDGPDCLILDFDLPDMDAFEFLKEAALQSTRSRPAIVVITGQGNEGIAVEAMKLGVQDYLIKGQIDQDGLVGAIESAVAKQSVQNEREEEHLKLERMALYDALTGLANRNLFNSRMEHAVALVTRRGDTACLLMIDLDRFKDVNDNFGHLVGDEALKEIGQRLMNVGRRADTVARIGGDEFAFLMETGATMEGAITVANKIVAALTEPITVQENRFSVGVSVGISLFSGHAADMYSVLQQADAAMYEAKRAGGGFKIAPTTPRPVPPGGDLKRA